MFNTYRRRNQYNASHACVPIGIAFSGNSHQRRVALRARARSDNARIAKATLALADRIDMVIPSLEPAAVDLGVFPTFDRLMLTVGGYSMAPLDSHGRETIA